jgi:single-stranded DNA-specific DHH superfamily exonuclease
MLLPDLSVDSCILNPPYLYPTVLLVPDKDIDGLSSTFILYKTLLLLSHPPSLISLHFLPRSTNIHSPSTSNLPSRCPPLGPATRIIILDQGSRSSPPIVPNDPEEVNILIIDHHYSLIFPPNATILSACQSEPIATTSLLAYTLCSLPVLGSSRIRSSCASLALLGLYGDLGGYSKYAKEVDPWPQDLIEVEKSVGKTNLAKAAAMCNAPRRYV